jgi:hypothetical protein
MPAVLGNFTHFSLAHPHAVLWLYHALQYHVLNERESTQTLPGTLGIVLMKLSILQVYPKNFKRKISD